MLRSSLISLVDLSRRFYKSLILLAFVLSVALGSYVSGHLTINTNINQLLADNLDWRQREKALDLAFPQKLDNLVIVVDGDSEDKAEAAADLLAKKLALMPDKFTLVSRPDALPFFRQNGLLYLSKAELADTLDQIAQMQPMLASIVSDPSLRGFFATINLMMQGVKAGALDPKQIDMPLSEVNKTLQAALDNKDHPLDLQKLIPSDSSAPRGTRKYILTKPVLDYSSLQPGEVGTKIVRELITQLNLTPSQGVHVRLTGPVPLNDEEFATVAEGMGLATTLSGIFVLVLLFLALRTWRIVLPIMLTLTVGLIASTAFAAFAVGSLNLISVAFAVMFIGIAVDFGIQFGVRYRDQHHQEPNHAKALKATAGVIAVPLAMAAGSTALGFLSFIPTSYRGVSELGLIAGVSMLIAFILNITLLPALMTMTKPPPESIGIGYEQLAPLNRFLSSKRKKIIPSITLLILIGALIATHIHFDFDPLDLKNSKTESVSTMLEIMQDPDSNAYAADLLTPSSAAAMAIKAKLETLPDVDHVMTLSSFVPEQQDQKLAMISDTTALLAPLFLMPPAPAADDQSNRKAVRAAAALLHQAGPTLPAVQNLADTLDKLARATPEVMQRAQSNIVGPLQSKLSEIKNALGPHRVTLENIPPALARDWVTGDGNWLVEIFPKRGADNNPRDSKRLNDFLHEIQMVAPEVSGTPVSIHESGKTIISAFVHAGIYGLISISLLAFVVLRRFRDVLLMITPLILAGILTLATIVLIGMPLNYANIIALPLLFSLGVSYAVYFVFYGKSGQRDFLQSSMAKAVLFSAGTVLVAFVSLCFSSHPGTRGMGELLTIALLYSLLCTFFVLPVLYAFSKKDK